MLAKVWKKVLFAVCIVACIYNVMHKLIRRTSLEAQLKSVQNQGSIIQMLDDTPANTTKKENSSNHNTMTNSTPKNEVKKDENTIVVVY